MSTCSRPTSRCARPSSARARPGRSTACATPAPVSGSAEAQAHGRRAERNSPPAHARPLRAPDRPRRPTTRLALAAARRGRARDPLAPVARPAPRRHVARAALELLWTQAQRRRDVPGVDDLLGDPDAAQRPALAAEWEPRLTLPDYERDALCGMAMTEKQGGSDLRANTTRAGRLSGDLYELTGHKWFCSAPMSDGFLTSRAARRGAHLLRRRAAGTRNRFVHPAAEGEGRQPLELLRARSSSDGTSRGSSARRAAASRP